MDLKEIMGLCNITYIRVLRGGDDTFLRCADCGEYPTPRPDPKGIHVFCECGNWVHANGESFFEVWNEAQKDRDNLHALSDEAYRDIKTLGNGNVGRGRNMLAGKGERLNHARTKHPHFADDIIHAVHLLQSEMDEVQDALLHEGIERVLDEVKDVAAVCDRILCGEYGKKTNKD